MKERFRNKRFNQSLKIKLTDDYTWIADVKSIILAMIEIIESYQERDIKMTLRQLYYQLVSHDIIPNHDKVYKKLSIILTDCRYNGFIDWDAIEDRVRVPSIPSSWGDIDELVDSAIDIFKLPRWNNQEYYVELLTEKDALSSILEPIADKWHIPFCVNRGYASATAIYSLYKRVFEKIIDDKKIILLYLGDHDPSGIDMCRDIEDRLTEFLKYKDRLIYDFNIVHPIALTIEQIKKYNPPPNPTKIKDPRSKWYIEKYGESSWEVDALPPDVMMEIVENSICKYVNMEEWNKVLQEEEEQISRFNYHRD